MIIPIWSLGRMPRVFLDLWWCVLTSTFGFWPHLPPPQLPGSGPWPLPQACLPCVQLPSPHTWALPTSALSFISSLPSQQKVPSLLYSCSIVNQASIFHSIPRDPSLATFQCALAASRFLQWAKPWVLEFSTWSMVGRASLHLTCRLSWSSQYGQSKGEYSLSQAWIHSLLLLMCRSLLG